MTNSEAIKQLKYIRPKMGDLFYHLIGVEEECENAIDVAIKSLEENVKLKCKNDRLKERLEIKDNNFELYSDALDEIIRLKIELEQSVNSNKLVERLLKEVFSAECYSEEFNGQEVNNLLCLGNICSVLEEMCNYKR